MTTTRVSCEIRAPREAVYRALIDPRAIARWRLPEDMRCEVHEFDARVGGRLRISLSYLADTGAGKTSARTDTYHGRFLELVPNERVVEEDEFETTDPALQGPMRMTITLVEREGMTVLVAEHADLPPGLSPADNETGWRMALRRLKELLEREAHP
ncbi:SRPBCC domain-containing protein [Niveibacterium sp. SC-1]|uniref:SRPBCC domain-containing protein n=1 Tax=Niveibacterium sp. SC-1 TaxID=3135646 RepID=UPI00311F13BE